MELEAALKKSMKTFEEEDRKQRGGGGGDGESGAMVGSVINKGSGAQ